MLRRPNNSSLKILKKPLTLKNLSRHLCLQWRQQTATKALSNISTAKISPIFRKIEIHKTLMNSVQSTHVKSLYFWDIRQQFFKTRGNSRNPDEKRGKDSCFDREITNCEGDISVCDLMPLKLLEAVCCHPYVPQWPFP